MPPPTPAAPFRLLLVEDEALLREILSELLRDAGFLVTEAAHGAAALAVLQSDAPIDLLLSDIKLPDMDGYTVAEAGNAAHPGLKVILMTGYAPSPLPATLQSAVYRVLQKPFPLEELLRILRSAVGA
ncbi:response regulator [Dyella sp.]|jgi:CheY-like chemotaxis protein|uniref:response regulator n=1 Tax=Dyella sp. TaxID=1869338 RepID=UPI002D77291C|nr:response regulator [Dyella sp.]HET6432143.1 response regulator [Dyella sp.]